MPVECAAVVKADGYGCGLEPVAAQAGQGRLPDLLRRRRCRGAPRARGRAASARSTCSTGSCRARRRRSPTATLRPVINSTTELAEWDSFVATKQLARRRGAARRHRHEPARHHASTRRSRIAPRLQSENHGFTLLMSHLACADTPDHPLNDRQIRLFREIRIMYRGVPSSLANSSGIFLGGTRHCDLVRPGVALFGVNPTAGTPESDAAGGRAQGPHHPGAHRRARAKPSAMARPGPPARPSRHRDRRRRLRATAILRVGRRRQAARPPPTVDRRAASAARSPAASRWT